MRIAPHVYSHCLRRVDTSRELSTGIGYVSDFLIFGELSVIWRLCDYIHRYIYL